MLTLPLPTKPKKGTVYQPRKIPDCISDLRVCIIEPGDDCDRGSMGCRYVIDAAECGGFRVDYVTPDQHKNGGPWDVELVSVHHCTEFPLVKSLPKRAKYRIVGGHPSGSNIRPIIPFSDVVCIGEGEEWIVRALDIFAAGGSPRDIDLPGTIISGDWENGSPMPETNTVHPLPKHKPYLNRSGEGHAQNWYIEMARGCPFVCHYCELGWAWKYRPQDTSYLLDAIDSIDKKKSKRVSLFAPDEASHPGYAECLQRIHDRGLITSFGSMRLDMIVKQNLPIKPNMTVRVGLDGLTEKTRFQVKKPIKDKDVFEYFRFMIDRGHVSFKIFMVFGYPWETLSDFDEWQNLMLMISRIPIKKSVHVRIKFTPLIPSPSTPLAGQNPIYDMEMIEKISDWFSVNKDLGQRPGWMFISDGIMSARSHALQCKLTNGDERTLLDYFDWNGTETLKGYDID